MKRATIRAGEQLRRRTIVGSHITVILHHAQQNKTVRSIMRLLEAFLKYGMVGKRQATETLYWRLLYISESAVALSM